MVSAGERRRSRSRVGVENARYRASGSETAAPRRRNGGKPGTQPWRSRKLLTDAEFLNNRLVALGVVLLEVVEQTTPFADQHEKSAARAVVFLVRFKVLRQLADAFAEQRDLNFRATGIARVRAVLANEGLFLFSG
jgi:hypothetical protein